MKYNKKEIHYYYYKNGKVKYEEYYLDDKRHREDGPAYIDYYKNGKVKYEEYYLDDKLHREDGPACIGYYENGKVRCETYYLDDKEYSKREYYNRSSSCEGKVVEIDGKKYKLTSL